MLNASQKCTLEPGFSEESIRQTPELRRTCSRSIARNVTPQRYPAIIAKTRVAVAVKHQGLRVPRELRSGLILQRCEYLRSS